MKASHIFGIILAIALIAFAVAYPVPEKHLYVSSYNYSEKTWTDEFGEGYVGGDAYNYQMEASLKAGYMSGVMTMKSVAFVGGLLLFFGSWYSGAKVAAITEQTRVMAELAKTSGNCDNMLRQLLECTEKQAAAANALSGMTAREHEEADTGVQEENA